MTRMLAPCGFFDYNLHDPRLVNADEGSAPEEAGVLTNDMADEMDEKVNTSKEKLCGCTEINKIVY